MAPQPPKAPSPSGFSKGPDRTLFQSKILHLVEADFTMPDGAVVQREIIRHMGAVAVVPVIGDDVVLVRQYRPAIDAELWELPAGKLDIEGEDPAVAAQRELQEEAGYVAESLESLGDVLLTPGFCDERIQLFLGRDLRRVERDVQGGEEQFMTIEQIPMTAALAMVASGAINDSKTVVGLHLAQTRL